MYKKFFAAVALICVVSVGAHAQTAATETYISETQLSPGTVVSLREGETEYVEPARQDNQDRLFGVIVRQSDPSIRLQEEGRTVFVTTFGKARAYVTDLNGQISAGDSLTISPITGVVMKSTEQEPVIGVALSDYNLEQDTLTTKEVENSEGEVRTVNVGAINVQVNPKQGSSSAIPSFIASFGESVAGKPVTSFRLFTALAVMVITLASSAVILFGAIRSSIIAIGRNPLSKSFVYKGLFQVLAIVTIIFIGGTIGSYIILRI